MLTKEEVAIRLGIDMTQLKSQSAVAGQVVEGTLKKSLRAMNRLLSFNLVGLFQNLIHGAVDVGSKALAEMIFDFNKEAKAVEGARLEAQRQDLRRMRQEQEDSAKRVADLEAKHSEDLLTGAEKIKKRSMEILDLKEKEADLVDFINKGGSIMATPSGVNTTAQTELSKARLEIREKQLEIDRLVEDADKLRSERFDARKKSAERLLSGGQFGPTIEQIAGLESESAAFQRMANQMRIQNRQTGINQFDLTAQGLASQASALRQGIAGNLNQQLNKPMTPQERIIADIVGGIAKGVQSTGAVPVAVTNVSND